MDLIDRTNSRLVHADRVREIERSLRHRAPRRPARRSIRQGLGRGLIRLGSALAPDAPLQPLRR